MATMYAYQTIYGIEPYDALGVPVSDNYGGGAKSTNDNFLITLWGITSQTPQPSSGNLIKPFVNTTIGSGGVAAALSAGVGIEQGFSPVFKSRYSARIYLEDGEIEVPEQPSIFFLPEFMMAVLRPPQDLKDYVLHMARVYKTTASSNPYPKDLDFLRSFFAALSFDFSAMSEDFEPLTEEASFGNFGYNNVGLPFLKTDGSNGVFPTFWDVTSNAAFFATLEALLNGADFFVPCVFSRTNTFETTLPEVFTFSWPGSHARR